MMVREQDVGHSLGLHAEVREGVDHQAPIWDHSRVHQQAGVAVEDQRDRRRHVVAVDRSFVNDVQRGAAFHLTLTA